MLGHATGKGVVGQQGMGQVICIHCLAEQLAVGADATDRNAAEIDPVVALGATDQFGLGGLTFLAPVGAGHLQGGVGTL